MSDYQSKHTGMVIDLCIEKVPVLETKLAKTDEDILLLKEKVAKFENLPLAEDGEF